MKKDQIQSVDEQELLNVTGGEGSSCRDQKNREDCEAADVTCYWHCKLEACTFDF